VCVCMCETEREREREIERKREGESAVKCVLCGIVHAVCAVLSSHHPSFHYIYLFTLFAYLYITFFYSIYLFIIYIYLHNYVRYSVMYLTFH
jgi:hypothetical protein